MLYDKIDEFAIKKWPLIEKFRSLGAEIREFRLEHPQNEHLSKESIEFIENQEKNPGFKAYWEVQAQYNLIVTDIFGENPHSNITKSTCNTIGQVFQWIKAADNDIDSLGNPVKQAKRLIEIKEKLTSKQYDSTLELYLSEEFNNFSEKTKNIINYVYESEIARILAPNDVERMRYRSENGAILGNLEYQIMIENELNIPKRANSFLMNQGRAGAFFDDIKDFHIDKDAGEGYTHDVRLKLFIEGASYFKKSLQVLSKEEKRRYSNFLKLGGLYQLREVIKIQEKT